MQNLDSSCDEESNNIVISKWGRPRFAVCPQHMRLMAGFGAHSAAFTSSTATVTATATATTTATTTTTTTIAALDFFYDCV